MVKLKRELNLFQLTVISVGIILGAGIYALIGVAAETGGNAIWLSFLISAIIALFTGLSYAELSAMFKGNAGEYDYISKAMNKKLGLFIGLSVIFVAIITSATVALGFAGYFTTIIPIPYIIAAILVIIFLTIFNMIGIKQATLFNIIATVVEFVGLILIILIGFKYIGTVNLFEMPQGLSGVFVSAGLVFFAYIGFESLVKLKEETKNPDKTIPKAIILSVIITTILYILVAVSAVSVVGWQALSQSAAPLALVAQTALGGMSGQILVIIALFSTANTILIGLVTASRQIYGIAKEKALPQIFTKIHERTRTPLIAVYASTAVAILFVLIGDIAFVANLTNLLLFFTFGLVNLSLIILRYKTKPKKGKFRCPVNIGRFPLISLLGMISSVVMIGVILWGFFA
jgi:basic amino acid/polyamine antiporter, APA family